MRPWSSLQVSRRSQDGQPQLLRLRVLAALRRGLASEQVSGILARTPDHGRISYAAIYSACYSMPIDELRAEVMASRACSDQYRCPGAAGTDGRALTPNAVGVDLRPIDVSERLGPGHSKRIKGARKQSQISMLVKRPTIYTMFVQLDNAAPYAESFGFVRNSLAAVMQLSVPYEIRKMLGHN